MHGNHTIAVVGRALATATVVALLAACGTAQADEAQVASAPPSRAADAGTAAGTTSSPGTATSGTATSGTATSADAHRPQLRLDDPPQRRWDLLQDWSQCLVENGAQQEEPNGRPVPGGPSGDPGIIVADPVPEAALAACAQLLPLDPPELDPATNPGYREDFLAMVDCLREHSVMVHAIDDPSGAPGTLSWTYDDDAPAGPDDQAQIEDACTLEAFGGAR